MILSSIKFPGEAIINTSYTYQDDLITSKTLSSMSSTLTYTYSPIGELREVRQGSAIIYRSTKVNALGRELTSLRSNTTISCVSQYSNGYLIAQQATRFGVSLFNFQYGWNQNTGNLTSRADLRSSLSAEQFAYDEQDRLTQSTVNNVSLGIAYNDRGNITYKQGVGNFSYESPKIHALVRSSPVGQQGSTQAIPPHQQDITYDALSRPATITENGFQMAFTYGANGERCKSVLSYQGTVIETRLYAGEYERVTKNGQTWHIQYISGVDGLVAMLVNSNGTSQMHYVFTDHLGSIVRTVLPHGAISSEQNFDAWGRRRNPTNWTYSNVGTRPDWLIRGFTGHEHLDVFNLIHMNARLYDPLVSRMLSPDNYVVDPDATQAYNRYSYCLNNPLKYVDPDGNEPITVAIIIGAAIGAYMGGTLANGSYNPGNWDFSSGRTWGYMAGGALVGGLSAWASAGIASSGVAFANTQSILIGSTINSVGTFLYTGGATDISISIGIASFTFSRDGLKFGYLGKAGNSLLTNIAYGVGASINLSDAINFVRWDGLSYEQKVEKIKALYGDESVYYDPNLTKAAQYNPNDNTIAMGRESLKYGKGLAKSSYEHELLHRFDWHFQPSLPKHIDTQLAFNAFLETRSYGYELQVAAANKIPYYQYKHIFERYSHYSSQANIPMTHSFNYSLTQWILSLFY